LISTLLLVTLGCGNSPDYRLPAPPAPCFATTALPVPASCEPSGRATPTTEGDLTCTYKTGGDRCSGQSECFWVGARRPAAEGTITCTRGTCSITVEVVRGAAVPDGARGEWARMANKGEPAGFQACETMFPGPPLR
jgi:hypothetical protein